MFFSQRQLPETEVRLMSLRILAHIGDAVFHLYERERELLSAETVSQMHQLTSRRASAAAQAAILDHIAPELTEEEGEIVRRARNIKPQRQKRTEQAAYRKSTAFEALLGYLYLTDVGRLKHILQQTLPESPERSADAD